jgi:hypothetical protein
LTKYHEYYDLGGGSSSVNIVTFCMSCLTFSWSNSSKFYISILMILTHDWCHYWSRNFIPLRCTWVHYRVFVWLSVGQSLLFCVVFCISLCVLLFFALWPFVLCLVAFCSLPCVIWSFALWPMYNLFSDVRLLITSVASSNSS